MKETSRCCRKQTLRHIVFLFFALCVFGALARGAAAAQTFSVIHSFTGGSDGYEPQAGLTIDQGGNLYGTASDAYNLGFGSAYQLKKKNGAWIFNLLSTFSGTSGVRVPQGRIVQGPGGALYGTSTYGGTGDCGEFGCGTVYVLRPPQTICRAVNCLWTDSAVFGFPGIGLIGWNPQLVDPAFDSAGNIYGTTQYGGANYEGNVFQLTRSNGVWTATSIHDFNGSDGQWPQVGVTVDSQGDIYGPVWLGGCR